MDKCVAHARAAGARIVDEPHDVTDADGTVRVASIAAYGDTVHTLVDRSRYRGVYLPGYVPRTSEARAAGQPAFIALDHVVGNVELGADGRVGGASTTGSWGSPTWPSSSATTSPPSTRR